MRASSLRAQGCALSEPRSEFANLEGMDARKARRLGCRFFGLLFFGQAKKSDSLTAVSETRGNAAGRLRKHKNKSVEASQMDPGLRRDDELLAAFAGMTKRERNDEARE